MTSTGAVASVTPFCSTRCRALLQPGTAPGDHTQPRRVPGECCPSADLHKEVISSPWSPGRRENLTPGMLEPRVGDAGAACVQHSLALDQSSAAGSLISFFQSYEVAVRKSQQTNQPTNPKLPAVAQALQLAPQAAALPPRLSHLDRTPPPSGFAPPPPALALPREQVTVTWPQAHLESCAASSAMPRCSLCLFFKAAASRKH